MSLLEILIIIALLSGVLIYFFPSLEQRHLAQNREQAQAALLDLAQALRAFHADRATYVGAAGASAEPQEQGAPWIVSAEVPGGGAQTYYRLRIAQANAQGYEIRAVPADDQINDACGTLTLTSGGVRGMLNAQADRLRSDCWTDAE